MQVQIYVVPKAIERAGTMTDVQQSPPQPPRKSEHKDWTESIRGTPFYVRFQCGPDYENAYLCVDDGEPDMHDLAAFYSHQTARDFVTTMLDYS